MSFISLFIQTDFKLKSKVILWIYYVLINCFIIFQSKNYNIISFHFIIGSSFKSDANLIKPINFSVFSESFMHFYRVLWVELIPFSWQEVLYHWEYFLKVFRDASEFSYFFIFKILPNSSAIIWLIPNRSRA